MKGVETNHDEFVTELELRMVIQAENLESIQKGLRIVKKMVDSGVRRSRGGTEFNDDGFSFGFYIVNQEENSSIKDEEEYDDDETYRYGPDHA